MPVSTPDPHHIDTDRHHAIEVGALERELTTFLQSTLDIAERISKLAPSRRMSLVVTKLEEAQMRSERR